MKIPCGIALTEGPLGEETLILYRRTGRVLKLLDKLFVLDGFLLSLMLGKVSFHFQITVISRFSYLLIESGNLLKL